ncbi:MAG: prepilin-type N-terminal cleavage/methylation domain-containing protein [Syntrophobacteraceae bacterium]|nr:prepilin-type N-terminal cleavage/methylation domain-containing protein [Syntrophobacteraceae bacterium]
MRLNGNKERLPGGVAKRGGFTLVEVMVSMVVLALGLLASVIGIIAALNHTMLNDLRAQGIEVAQELVERVQNEPFKTFDTNHFTDFPTSVTRAVRNQSVTYNIVYSSARYPTTGGTHAIYSVKFVVSWNAMNDNHIFQPFSYTLQTQVGQDQ